MKTTIALLAFTLTLPSFAEAARDKTRAECAFGESTGDLSEMLESKARGKVFHQGEHISVHSMQRLQGLTETEKKMVLIARGAELGTEQEKNEAFEDFTSSDGHLTYFSPNEDDRQFVKVASYPGDNEFGVILELKSLRRRGEYKILSTVAIITDSDFEDCQVKKGEIR